MFKLKRRPGFTLLETMISFSILTLVLSGATMIWMSLGRGFDKISAQLDVDQSCSTSVQRMMMDLEEAKQVTVNSASSMTVYFPQVAADGTYIRSALDNTNTISYFRGTSAGVADAAGDSFIRQPAGGTAKVICTGVTNVQFTSTNPSSVDITLQARRTCAMQPAETDIIHRAIFLRNY